MCSLLSVICLALLASDNQAVSGIQFQQGDACGHLCLYAVAKVKGKPLSFSGVKDILGPGNDGVHSLHELSDAARTIGLFPLPARVNQDRLLHAPFPVIAHVRGSFSGGRAKGPHYVVLLSANSEGVQLLDPPFAAQTYPWPAFENLWTGNVLLVADSSDQQRRLIDGLSRPTSDRIARYALVCCAIGIVWLVLQKWISTVVRQLVGILVNGWSIAPRWRTPRVVGFATIATVSAIVVALWLNPNRIDGPELQIDDNALRLGKLPSGINDITLPIKNIGKKSLIVKRIQSSCVCVSAELPPPISSGDTGLLKLSIRAEPGPRGTQLMMWSNDVRGPARFKLEWSGRGSDIHLYPPKIVAVLDGEDIFERTVQIVFSGGNGVEIPKVIGTSCDDSNVLVEIGGSNPVAFAAGVELVPGRQTLGCVDVSIQAASIADTAVGFTVQYEGQNHELLLPISVRRVSTVAPRVIVFSGNDFSSLIGQRRRVKVRTHEVCENQRIQIMHKPDWLQCYTREISPTEYELEFVVSSLPDHLSEPTVVVVDAASGSGRKTEIPIRTWVSEQLANVSRAAVSE